MCFSATASFAASGTLAIAGGATLAKAKRPREVPLASIPLLFAFQQLAEGMVWISFSNQALNSIASYVFLMFAFVVWPSITPLSMYLIEPNKKRKVLLTYLMVLGFVISIGLFVYLMKVPLLTEIMGNSIRYNFVTTFGHKIPIFIYVSVLSLSLIVSSYRGARIGGVALFGFFLFSTFIYTKTYVSVWCFSAAILSLMIYLAFRNRVFDKKHIISRWRKKGFFSQLFS